MTSGNRFSFDELYSAFGRSLEQNENGIRHASTFHLSSRQDANDRKPGQGKRGPGRQDQLRLGSATEKIRHRVCPVHLSSLFALQNPDGSWDYSNDFHVTMNGVATRPPEGISEWFSLLHDAYEKAALHLDNNVLARARGGVDLTSVHKIRTYPFQDLKALEARRKQEEEDLLSQEEERLEQEQKAARAKEIRAIEDSFRRVRKLPAEVRTELLNGYNQDVFTALHPEKAVQFQAGDAVEYNEGGSNSMWKSCSIRKIVDSKKVVIRMYKRSRCIERQVSTHELRRPLDQIDSFRKNHLDKFRSEWQLPARCADELERIREEEKKGKYVRPWDGRLVERKISKTTSLPQLKRHCETDHVNDIDKATISNDEKLDKMYEKAMKRAMDYDGIYKKTCKLVGVACKQYKMADLFRDRLHAFDTFLASLVELMRASVHVLKEIRAWKSYSLQLGNENCPRIFMWHGSNLIIRIVRSLDFLSSVKEVRGWYGEEFMFAFNPFMRSISLLDKAHEQGLTLTRGHSVPPNHLRDALKIGESKGGNYEIPTWWPERHYDSELQNQIAAAEEFLINELVECGVLQYQAVDGT